MIVAEQKSLDEIKSLVGDAGKVLVVGCGTCVTVCFAGGAREAAITASYRNGVLEVRLPTETTPEDDEEDGAYRIAIED